MLRTRVLHLISPQENDEAILKKNITADICLSFHIWLNGELWEHMGTWAQILGM